MNWNNILLHNFLVLYYLWWWTVTVCLDAGCSNVLHLIYFSQISLFLVCRQRSSWNVQPDFPSGLLNLTKTTSWTTRGRYLILFGTHLKLLITGVFSLAVPLGISLILFLVSKTESCQTHHRLRHACVQGASGRWLYADSQSRKDCIRNEWVRPQPDFWVQLRYPKEEEKSQGGEE